jgi:hypothetical protein
MRGNTAMLTGPFPELDPTPKAPWWIVLPAVPVLAVVAGVLWVADKAGIVRKWR